jgi:formylglycine-generating enzyme required for sulfatase activity
MALQQQKEDLQQALEQRDEQERSRQLEHEQLLEETRAELRDQQQQLEADLSRAGEQQALLEGQLDELKQQHEQDRQQLESDAEGHERSVTALQGEARQLELRIREQAEKIDNLLTDKQAAAEALNRQTQEWEGERALFISGNDEMQQQLAKLEEQLEQVRERAAEDKAGLQAELDALTSKSNRKIEDREAQCVELKQGQSRLLKDLEAIQKERDSFQRELGAAMDAAAGQQQKIDALKAQVASVAGSADEHVQSLEIQLEAGRLQFEDLERQAADRLAQQHTMQEEIAGMKATESRLEQEAMVLQQEKEALQQALQQRDEQENARQLESGQLLAQAHDDLIGKNEIERELQGQVDRLRKKLEQTTSEIQNVREVAQTDVDSIREELHKERSARSAERAEMAARQRELKEQLMSVATEHEENITNHTGAIEQAQITAREEEQARIQQMREIQLEAEAHLEKLQSELNQAHDEIAALVEREKTRRHEEHDLIENRKEQSESTLNQLRTQTEQLVQERDAALKDQRDLREKVNSLRAEVEVTRGLMGGGQGQAEDPLKLRRELDEARKNVEIAVRLRAEAEAACASLKEERNSLQKQVGNTLILGKPLNIPLLYQNPKQADRAVFSAKPAKQQPVTSTAGKQLRKPSGAVTDRWGRLARMTGIGVIVFAGILYALKTYVDLPVDVVTPGQGGGEVFTGTSPASSEAVDSGQAAGSQVLVSGQETVPVVESVQSVTPDPRGQATRAVEPPEPVTEAAARPQRPAAAGSFRERLQGGGVAPLMVKLPAADFMMGSPGKSLNRDEGPRHEVSLSRFAISKYEVTFSDYDRFARATGARLPHDETWGRGNRPVINISWKDAQAYVRWLSAQTGHTYRLPTEAQWEYAARAGATTPFPWEFGTDDVHANCFDCGSEWDKRMTAPVGSFPDNYFGLHDMGGNAQEWTEDCYRAGYDGAPADGSALSIFGCTQRAVRGGAYTSPSNSLRSARRGQYDQDTRLDNLGFRIVRNY